MKIRILETVTGYFKVVWTINNNSSEVLTLSLESAKNIADNLLQFNGTERLIEEMNRD